MWGLFFLIMTWRSNLSTISSLLWCSRTRRDCEPFWIVYYASMGIWSSLPWLSFCKPVLNVHSGGVWSSRALYTDNFVSEVMIFVSSVRIEHLTAFCWSLVQALVFWSRDFDFPGLYVAIVSIFFECGNRRRNMPSVRSATSTQNSECRYQQSAQNKVTLNGIQPRCLFIRWEFYLCMFSRYSSA